MIQLMTGPGCIYYLEKYLLNTGLSYSPVNGSLPFHFARFLHGVLGVLYYT